MGVDHHDAFVLLALLAAIAALLALSPFVRVPYPILLVLGGLAAGFAPGVPDLELPPDLVLVVLLPPLLYGAAFFTSLRDLRTNIRPIGLLAIGLVLTTMVTVAVVAHEVVELPWLPYVEGEDPAVAVPYANFYICNGGLIVPTRGEETDAEALALLESLYPGREAVAVAGETLALGGGGVHCITQQVPAV